MGHSRMNAYDVAVLGAGIIGAACAQALAIAGLRVIVLDRAPIGSGATAAGMGHLLVLDDSEAQFALTKYSCELWNALAPQLPPYCEFIQSGTLWIAADDEEMAGVHRKHAYYRRRGVATEILDGRAIAEVEPNLRPGLVGGLRVRDDALVYPPCAAHWLIDEARARGAEIRLNAEVNGFDSSSVRLHDGSRIVAKHVVHATGTWARTLFPHLPVRPKKGHLVITERYPGFITHPIVELGYLKSAHGGQRESVAFNLQPRKTGQLLLGSSRQVDTDTTHIEPHMLGRMITRAFEYMPRLRRLSVIRTWTGFRAATPDSLPLIGPITECPGHFLATGHEGLGITTSLATAELIVAHIVGREAPIPLTPYLPGRFAEGGRHG
jgi:glycine/D-amino acid oxidase-like deaminating enzyme